MQMASLLHMSSGRADVNYMESLQRQLNQTLGDVRMLQEKLHKYEKQEVSKFEQSKWHACEGLMKQVV